MARRAPGSCCNVRRARLHLDRHSYRTSAWCCNPCRALVHVFWRSLSCALNGPVLCEGEDCVWSAVACVKIQSALLKHDVTWL